MRALIPHAGRAEIGSPEWLAAMDWLERARALARAERYTGVAVICPEHWRPMAAPEDVTAGIAGCGCEPPDDDGAAALIALHGLLPVAEAFSRGPDPRPR